MTFSISIAMATYNGARHIGRQLQSFVEQTVQPDELIVTDDGSTDNTIEIIREFALEAPFEVRLERNETNLGYAQNFGKAASLCTGDLIFFSDQDDVWLPEKVERVANAFTEWPNSQVIINDARIVDGDLGDTGLTTLGQIRALGLRDASFVTGCCSAFRTEFREILFPVPDEIFVHDTWLHTLSNLLAVRSVLEEPLQLYRRHDTNTSAALQTAVRPLSQLDLVRAYSGANSREFTERTQRKIAILRQRLDSCQGAVYAVSERGFADARHRLHKTEAATRRRLEILSQRRLRRILPAAAMYLNGHYTQFSGWRSLVKDIVKS